jgi:hypothetical protein
VVAAGGARRGLMADGLHSRRCRFVPTSLEEIDLEPAPRNSLRAPGGASLKHLRRA